MPKTVAPAVSPAQTTTRSGRALRFPHFGPGYFGLVGVVLMTIAGLLRLSDFQASANLLWSPFITIASIMVISAAIARIGLLDRIGLALFSVRQYTTYQLFQRVFVLSVLTSAILNNDAAVLLELPLVITLIRQRYPGNTSLERVFAMAVFMAAGVAPLMISNPMNLIVAQYVGIDFNTYAAYMAPISLAGWILTYYILRLLVRRYLAAEPTPAEPPQLPVWSWAQRSALVVVLGILVAYPVVTYLGGPVWLVSAIGAVLTLAISHYHGVGSARTLVVKGIRWEILVFLSGVIIMTFGLRNAGVVSWISHYYEHGGIYTIGIISAIGSALINNHPMGHLNMLAIPAQQQTRMLAALIGGDIGPRLLPWGSLAGLLWFTTLKVLDVKVTVREFIILGTILTIPSLALSLFMLSHHL